MEILYTAMLSLTDTRCTDMGSEDTACMERREHVCVSYGVCVPPTSPPTLLGTIYK